ncbi:unnamed protein product [Cunninghamella blakesleeana]
MMPKKLTNKDIDAILLTIGVDFQPIDKCVYFDVLTALPRSDSWIDGTDYKRVGNKIEYQPPVAVIKHGLNDYYFYSFYEVMIWYRFYTCKRHRIEKYATTSTGVRYSVNTSYFARIPRRYRSMSPKQGLNIVREAMGFFIRHYNGIPPSFTLDRLNQYYCKIENNDHHDYTGEVELMG